MYETVLMYEDVRLSFVLILVHVVLYMMYHVVNLTSAVLATAKSWAGDSEGTFG